MSSLYEFDSDRVAGSGNYTVGVAGESLGDRKIVYMGVNGRWYLADADAVATMPVIGLTMHTTGITLKGRILLKGFIGLTTWAWTIGTEVYASTTAGELTQTPPGGIGDTIQVVGIATQTTQIYFNPAPGGAGGSGCAVLIGATAYVGSDECQSPYANYFYTGDYATHKLCIEAACAYAGALGGGVVHLEPMTYTASVVVNEAEIVLEGEGWDTYINGAAVGHAVNVTGAQCQVRDLRVSTTGGATNNYDGVSITGADCIVERVWVSDSDRHGILVNGASGKIQHNLIESVDDNGVSIGATGDASIVSNNEIDTTGDDGILIDVAGEYCHVSDNIIAWWTNEPVDDNSGTSTVENNWAGGTVLTSKGCSMATIALAVTYVGAEGWIEVPSGTWDERVTLGNNDVILRGQGWDTIIDETADSGHAITITGARCVVRDLQCITAPGGTNAYNGIDISGADCLVDNVNVSGSDQDAIYVNGIRTRIRDCYLYDADRYQVNIGGTGDDSIISNNILNTSDDDGVYIDVDGENCIIIGNRITAWTNEAIDDDSGTATKTGNNTA